MPEKSIDRIMTMDADVPTKLGMIQMQVDLIQHQLNNEPLHGINALDLLGHYFQFQIAIVNLTNQQAGPGKQLSTEGWLASLTELEAVRKIYLGFIEAAEKTFITEAVSKARASQSANTDPDAVDGVAALAGLIAQGVATNNFSKVLGDDDYLITDPSSSGLELVG